MTKEFLFGFAVGAGFGVLIAPRSGQATRSKLRARAEQLFENSGAQAVSEPARAESPGAPEASNAVPLSVNVPVELGADQSVTEALNHARKSELTSVRGIGDVTAKRIIKNRPYTTAEEAVREEVIPEETLEKVKEQLVNGKADEESAA